MLARDYKSIFLVSSCLHTPITDRRELGKEMLERLENIEVLPKEEKEKIFSYIDLIIRDTKVN